MEENKIICSHCGAEITDDDYSMVNGQIVCSECVEQHTTICDSCGAIIWTSESYGDDYTTLCHHCYQNHYTRCSICNLLLHEDDCYNLNGEDLCNDCYHDEVDKCRNIHDYSYKPEPIFYGESSRYFGVELEIDGAGKDDDNAEELLKIANFDGVKEQMFVKSDGSLDDGMEIVTHPMTLDYHKHFCWERIMKRAIALGYRSHQTSTCGLHIHVNRNSLSDNYDEQESIISRILYFVEQHWNELLKFSRRSEATMSRWASRYGYENTPRAILDKAKKGNYGRYAAVNLCNYSTIEFRLFRGTLKHNTLIAALQLVNEICNAAVYMSDDEIQKLSWSEFVSDINDTELIQYLKERNLYINERINTEEDI